MAVITLQILKKFYDLHKDTNFWLERNEIRNAVLDYEKGWIDEVCWFDIDEAIEKMTNSPDSKLAILQKRREIPILKIAKEMITNKK